MYVSLSTAYLHRANHVSAVRFNQVDRIEAEGSFFAGAVSLQSANRDAVSRVLRRYCIMRSIV